MAPPPTFTFGGPLGFLAGVGFDILFAEPMFQATEGLSGGACGLGCLGSPLQILALGVLFALPPSLGAYTGSILEAKIRQRGSEVSFQIQAPLEPLLSWSEAKRSGFPSP